jgi:hypothetical protein
MLRLSDAARQVLVAAALTSLQTRAAQHARLLKALQAVGENDPERLAHHAAGAGDTRPVS